MALKHLCGCPEWRVLFNTIVKSRMIGIVPKETDLFHSFFNKTVGDGMFELGIASKEVLSRLFNPFNLKILDLHLEQWLWSPLICVEKSFTRELIYGIT